MTQGHGLTTSRRTPEPPHPRDTATHGKPRPPTSHDVEKEERPHSQNQCNPLSGRRKRWQSPRNRPHDAKQHQPASLSQTPNSLRPFVGDREIGSLEPPDQERVLGRRSDYERRFRELIERGVTEGAFRVQSARIASYSILDMGIGVAGWFHEGGEFSVDQLAYQYGDIALRIVEAQPPAGTGTGGASRYA
ncbi:hypothetical protein [Streptomyces sp. NPDC002088]|uniref:hypothetical protein n=1 Tax=Streptomyces sp. NPDC002088 TaxID=3154665 RepID=UPI00332FEACB